jgi:hypothetical protein
MSVPNTAELDFLATLFKKSATYITTDVTWYLGLHTGDPGEAGDQSTSETVYTNYARVAVTRATGFSKTSSGGVAWAFNVATVTFAQCGVTGATLTHFGLGRSSTAGVAGTLVFSGPLAASLAVSNGIAPQFNPDTLRLILD